MINKIPISATTVVNEIGIYLFDTLYIRTRLYHLAVIKLSCTYLPIIDNYIAVHIFIRALVSLIPYSL